MTTVIGLLIVLLPLGMTLFYHNQRYGFVHGLTWLFGTHIALGILLQTFNIVEWGWGVLGTIMSAILLYSIHRRKIAFPLILPKFDVTLIGVLLITVLHLFNAHYNYTGRYTVEEASSFQIAEHLSYPYPYFSDEWDAVALAKASLEMKRPPIWNPYVQELEPFTNFEAIFHSTITELFLLLDLNPLTGYVPLSIALNTLIVALGYLLLRQYHVAKSAAAFASLSILYITNGANLPGIWTMIPQTLGTIMLLLGLFMISCRLWLASQLLFFLTMISYPPFGILFGTGLIAHTLLDTTLTKKERYTRIFEIGILILLAASLFEKIFFYLIMMRSAILLGFIVANVVLLVLWLTRRTLQAYFSGLSSIIFYTVPCMLLANCIAILWYWEEVKSGYVYIASFLHYQSFTDSYIPQYTLWYIIPLPILFVATYGLYLLVKKRSWLASLIVACGVFWSWYTVSTTRIVIEYQRVVFISSVLLTLIASFGIHALIQRALSDKRRPIWLTEKILIAAILIGFGIASFFYTSRTEWDQLIVIDKQTGFTLQPGSPANQYLRPEDLALFAYIHHTRFLSLPWKGKTLGAATDNYAVSIKGGTIGREPLLAERFIRSDCEDKTTLAEQYELEYVYLPTFDCPDFEKQAENGYGLVLYKVIIDQTEIE